MTQQKQWTERTEFLRDSHSSQSILLGGTKQSIFELESSNDPLNGIPIIQRDVLQLESRAMVVRIDVFLSPEARCIKLYLGFASRLSRQVDP